MLAMRAESTAASRPSQIRDAFGPTLGGEVKYLLGQQWLGTPVVLIESRSCFFAVRPNAKVFVFCFQTPRTLTIEHVTAKRGSMVEGRCQVAARLLFFRSFDNSPILVMSFGIPDHRIEEQVTYEHLG